MPCEEAWFEGWFNSPYYALLYNNRDEAEADAFVRRITGALDIGTGGPVLDMGCGSGRHSRSLHSLGFDVTGIDLSEKSIAAAREHTAPTLRFDIADMRRPHRMAHYTAAFCLFTSFGYFEDDADNFAVIDSAAQCLTHDGIFVLDFFNSHQVIANLVPHETVWRGEVRFDISREHDGKGVCKSIVVDSGSRFQEWVRAYGVQDLKRFFTQAGLELESIYGDYQLNDFQTELSPRCIMVGRKPRAASR